MKDPRVSCICLTYKRVHFLSRAVECFLTQTYEDTELLIVYSLSDTDTVDYIASLAHPKIRTLGLRKGTVASLGELRNVAVRHARGHFIATWDDDDYHAPDRLTCQLAEIERTGKDACFLARWYVYDKTVRRTFVSRWRMWEGTMVCKKQILPAYAPLDKAEDTPIMTSLEKLGVIAALDAPALYVYVIHGQNTWDRQHFLGHVLRNATELSSEENERIQALLEA